MNKHIKQMVLMLSIVAVGVLVACNKDDDKPAVVEKTTLEASLTAANLLIETTSEGTATGQFLHGSQLVLQTAIDLAQEVDDSDIVTQTQVDNTVTALDLAITDYEGKEVVPIEPTALVGHWTFDDGTGSTASDFSGNSRNGTLKAGHADNGAGIPTWTTDRYGEANKALAFDNGAWVEVPYSSALNPGVITISVWAKATVTKGGNKILGLNRWEGYKFQLQDTPKAFFTAATASDGIFDKDTEPVLVVNTWYHLVVTFGAGHTIFYVNGVQGTDWDNTPGTLRLVEGYNLAIGIESSNIVEAGADFFEGTLDEIRIYNKVLTASQINSIYELEKVPE